MVAPKCGTATSTTVPQHHTALLATLLPPAHLAGPALLGSLACQEQRGPLVPLVPLVSLAILAFQGRHQRGTDSL